MQTNQKSGVQSQQPQISESTDISIEERFAQLKQQLESQPQTSVPAAIASRQLPPMKLSDPLPERQQDQKPQQVGSNLAQRINAGEGNNQLQRPAPRRAPIASAPQSAQPSGARITSFQIQPSLSRDAHGNNIQRRNRDVPDRPVIIMISEERRIVWLTTDLHFTNRTNGAAIQRGVDELNRQKSSRELIQNIQDWKLSITNERWPVESVQIQKAHYYDFYASLGYRVLGKRPNVGLPNANVQLQIPEFNTSPVAAIVQSTSGEGSLTPAQSAPACVSEIPVQHYDQSAMSAMDALDALDVVPEEYVPQILDL